MQTLSSISASTSASPGRTGPFAPAWSDVPPAGVSCPLNVLVVEDDDPVRRACAGTAETLGCRVQTAATVPAARTLLSASVFDVVFLDVRLPGESGESLLRELQAAQPHAFVVMMTAFATVSSALELMRSGAGEVLQKPFVLGQIKGILDAASRRRLGSAGSRQLQEQLRSGLAAGRLVGASEAMQRVFRMLAKVAPARHPALLLGERGTGKEMIARTIHANGPHPAAPFVPIDCDSLRPEWLEVELFGKPASASDPAAPPGVLVAAGQGTVYLSEIGSLEPQVQARLVRTLTERQVRSSPTGTPLPLQARLLASSSRDLLPLVETAKFRKDLYYRLNVVTLRIPPLRDRTGDIPLLVELFLEKQRQEHKLPYAVSEEALASMLRYDWAGNVEELESLIERACGLSSDAYLHFGDMSTQVKNFVQAAPQAREATPPSAAAGPSPVLSMQEIEKRAIADALRQLNGDKLLVARCLGIGKTTLYRKLKEYNLVNSTDASLA